MTLKTQIPEAATHFEPGRGYWWRRPNVVQADWQYLGGAGWVDDEAPTSSSLALMPIDMLDPAKFEHPSYMPGVLGDRSGAVPSISDLEQWRPGVPSPLDAFAKAHIKPCVAERAPWDGISPPPVGTVCEWQSTLGDDTWAKVEVRYLSQYTALLLFADETGRFSDFEGAYVPNECRYRPLRTAEQLAADHRLHEIRNACTAINKMIDKWNASIDCSAAIRATVEAMIDVGYCKVVEVPK